ncbi:MAG: N-acetyltransferase family protein [Pseudomonadota bacterium]
MNFHLRTAQLSDAPSIHAIYDEAVRTGTGSFDIEGPSFADMLDRLKTLQSNGYPIVVAVEDGLTEDEGEGPVIGFAYAGPHKPRSGYRFTVESSIYMAPRARKRGVGTALLQGIIAASERAGFRQMVAVIGDSANVGSILVHAKCGFEEVGIFKNVGHKFDRWLDVVFMQRQLGHGGAQPPTERAKSRT